MRIELLRAKNRSAGPLRLSCQSPTVDGWKIANLSDAYMTRSNSQLWFWTAVLTAAIEFFTCLLRFGLRLQSTRDTASTIGQLTCGLRIHHSYVGAAIVLMSCWLWNRQPRVTWWLLIIGLSLVFSDLIHHFLVLWPIEGSPQFDLVYPAHE